MTGNRGNINNNTGIPLAASALWHVEANRGATPVGTSKAVEWPHIDEAILVPSTCENSQGNLSIFAKVVFVRG
jgi:hypothetical protein